MAIERAIAESSGDILAAAKRLRQTKSTMYRRMKILGIGAMNNRSGGVIEISHEDPLVGNGEPVSLEAYEKHLILSASDQCHGNMLAAARLLRVGKSTLYRKMEALGIRRDRQ